MSGEIRPEKSILVGDDSVKSEAIFLKPLSIEYEIILKWKLISKDFKDNGELILKVQPDIQYESEKKFTEDPTRVGIVEGGIEDYIDNAE